jgi:P27 family predicted phage terminase small subunit
MSGKPRDRTALQHATPLEPGRTWATKEARELFRRIVADWPADHFKEADRHDLQVYVLAVMELQILEADIARDGLVLTDGHGRRYPNPAALLRDRAWVRIRDAGAKLRLHLSSRMRSEDANTAAKEPGLGLTRPWESAYFDDVPRPARSRKTDAEIAKRYGL